MIRPFRFALLLPLCCLGLACSAVQKPTAAFRSADVRDVTAEGFTVDFNLDVNNPNPVAVPLTSADYKLSLGGAKVIDDTVDPGASLPANGTLPVTLPVRLSFQDLLAAQRAIQQGGGDMPYEFEGALAFGGGSGSLLPGVPVKVPFNYKGTLPLRKVLSDPSALMSPAARKLAGQALESLFGR